MSNLCELRYTNGISNIEIGDVIIIFKGDIYHISSTNTDQQVDYIVNLLTELCKLLPGMKNRIFDEYGQLQDKFVNNNYNNLIDAVWNFVDTPRILFGEVVEDEEGLALEFLNSEYDVYNSPEFKQFITMGANKYFDAIFIDGKEIDLDNVKNNKPHTIKLANPLYHGTVVKYLDGILRKGLRKLQDNSIFSVHNEGFVFMTSVYDVANGFASMYSKEKNSQKAILKINSDYIDENKVVLDYDFVKEYTYPGQDDPYTNSPVYQHTFKGELAKNSKRYGTKFTKIGYKGMVMPKAIEGVYIYDNNNLNPQYFTRDEALKYISQMNQQQQNNESVERLNEYKPKNYDSLPNKIRLYHGTDIYALEDILIDGEINAKAGRRTGETYGVNWFFTSYKDNFSRGVMFSIEVDKSEFDNHIFEFMNNNEVTSRDNVVPIQGRDFRIENIDGYNQEVFNRLLKECNGDIYKFLEKLYQVCKLLNEVGSPYISEPINIQILKQTVGEDYLKKEGIIESVEHINEVDSSDISLKSFEVQDELNHKIWVNNKINSRVRLRLLDIADDFMDNLSVRWVKPEDIILTGSIANYNWSKYSDIDVHIIIDYKKVYERKDFVEDYFDSKKELWKRDHEDLTIYGFPVEMYVQDVDEKNESSGIYSLNKNEWIKEPKDIDDSKLNGDYVKEQAAKYMTMIDDYESDLKKEKDQYKIESIGKKVKKLLDKLKGIRKESLKRSGEMGSGNVIYKIIRRMGYLDKVWDIINNTYNKSKTIS